jgi:hypothetical protein
MADSVAEVKRRSLDEELEELVEDYKAVERKKRSALGPVEENKLGRELIEIEEKMKRIEQELKVLDASGTDRRRRDMAWRSRLSEIDYEKAFAAFVAIRKPLDKSGGAALFLIQDGEAMCAEWLVEKIQEELSRKMTAARRVNAGFHDGPPSLEGLLARLAVEFKVAAAANDTTVCTEALTQTMLRSLQTGSIVLIVMTILDNMGTVREFLGKFLAVFWSPLVKKLRSAEIAREAPRARIVAVIVVNQRLAPGCLTSEMCCTRANHDSEKILELKLQKWKAEEIKRWLEDCTNVRERLKPAQIEEKAKWIFEVGQNGVPARVLSTLEKFLNSVV